MTAIDCDLSFGWITLDGHSLHTPAWCAFDLSPLWGSPEVRGGNRLVPGATGVLPYRRRATETRLSLPFVVYGAFDADGTPNEDPFAGLEANLSFLYTYVILPTNTGDGTRELVWHRPSGSSTTADVHVIGYRPSVKPGGIALGTLEIADPTGTVHL